MRKWKKTTEEIKPKIKKTRNERNEGAQQMILMKKRKMLRMNERKKEKNNNWLEIRSIKRKGETGKRLEIGAVAGKNTQWGEYIIKIIII